MKLTTPLYGIALIKRDPSKLKTKKLFIEDVLQELDFHGHLSFYWIVFVS